MKDGDHGFPVYFLGALVIQANMAKVPRNPSDGLLVPGVGKAETQMAEWCDTAGHCWSIGLDSASSWSCTRTYEAERSILKERDVTPQPLPTLSNGTEAGTQGPDCPRLCSVSEPQAGPQ